MDDEKYIQAAKTAFIAYLVELTEQTRIDRNIQDFCNMTYKVYQGLIDAGFTPDEALDLLINMERP